MLKHKTYREVPVDAYNRFCKKCVRPVGETLALAMDHFLKNPSKKIDSSLVVAVRSDRSVRNVPLESHLKFVAYCTQHQLQVGIVLGQAMKNYFK